MKYVLLSGVHILVSLSVIGCTLEPGGETEPLAEDSEAVVNGQTVSSDYWGTLKFGNCNGTLLRDRWFLTTRTCNPQVGTQLTMRSGAQATVAGPVYQHPTYDVAIARTSTSLVPEGPSTVNGPFPLYRGAASALSNQAVLCQGWGSGTLMSAHPIVSLVETSGCPLGGTTQCYRLSPSAHFNALLGAGDFGAACMLELPQSKVTGVQTRFTSSHNWQVSAPYFRDWANGIIGSGAGMQYEYGLERSDGVTSYMDIFNNQIFEVSLVNGSWIKRNLTHELGAVPAAGGSSGYVRFDGYTSIVYRSSDGRIRELARSQADTEWKKFDLHAVVSNGPAPAAAGIPHGYARADRVSAVVYRGTNGRIHELRLEPGGGWQVSEISRPGTPNASGEPTGFVRADGKSAVVYVGTDNRIREVSRGITDTGWTGTDLMAIGPGTPPAPRGRLYPFTRTDGVTSIMYFDANKHIIEIKRGPNVNTWVNVTTTYNITPASLVSQTLAPYVRSDGYTTVLYFGNDSHIHELSLQGSAWSDFNLSGTFSSVAPIASHFTGFVRSDRYNSVMYHAMDGNYRELSLQKGGSGWVDSFIADAPP